MEGVEETEFPTWAPSVAVYLQVLRVTETGLENFGPEFEIRPVFSEKGSFILGREDFFSHFTITFTPPQYGSDPVLTLECD